jgi:hypothetical protein
MTPQPCERESSVIAAARSGVRSDDLESHIAACEICSETQRIAGLLQHAAKASAPNRHHRQISSGKKYRRNDSSSRSSGPPAA